jgi:hypothetical protein
LRGRTEIPVQPGTIAVGVAVAVVFEAVSGVVMVIQPAKSIKDSNKIVDIKYIALVFILFIIITYRRIIKVLLITY